MSGVRRHRRPGAVRRGVRRVGIAVAIVATVIAGEAIIRSEPNYYETVEQIYRQAEPNQRVQAGTILVTVLGVRGAAQIRPEFELPIDTAGVWIIVRVRLEATKESTYAQYWALTDGKGRSFRASGRFHQSLSKGRQLQPGIPVEGEVAFEVPRDAATSLRLQVSENYDDSSDGQIRTITDIRVPVTDDSVSQWLADSKPATIADDKVVT